MDSEKLKRILEAALVAANAPLDIDQLEKLFAEGEARPTRDEMREALTALEAECEHRGYELKKVASGYRFQVKQDYAPWVGRLWEEKAPRYSRATLETLALIAYRQPITRAEIEDIRGVSVSTNIIKSMTERDWIRVVGHKDVPGKPAMYGTTRGFLDYFNLKSLDELPTLAELRDLDKLHPELGLDDPDMPQERKPAAATEGDVEAERAEDESFESTDEAAADAEPLDAGEADAYEAEADDVYEADESDFEDDASAETERASAEDEPARVDQDTEDDPEDDAAEGKMYH